MSTLSVAMCTYNGARYIEQQLVSIAEQTRLPNELVICDDRSTDGTGAVIRSFAERAPFPVRFSINEHRLGITKNFERAVAQCQGDIIALADQDDVWLPGKLAALEAALLGRTSDAADLAFCDAEVVDEHLQPLGYSLWPTKGFSRSRQVNLQSDRAWRLLLKSNVVSGNTMAFRSEFKELVLPFSASGLHDAWLALLISCVGRVQAIPENLILYRQHRNNEVGTLDRSVGEMVVAAQTPANDIYDSAADLVEDVLGRLSERNVTVEEPIWRGLRGRTAFLRMRARLPQPRWRRLPRTFAGLISLGYHRYANGLKSFASDLVRPG
jgi:glycosyltransferase involved in cell wall biosynthesis